MTEPVETSVEWGVRWSSGYEQWCERESAARELVALYHDGVLVNREVTRTEWRTVDSEERRADVSKPVVTCDNGSRNGG